MDTFEMRVGNPMPELNELDCKIFVDGSLTCLELLNQVARLLTGTVEDSTISNNWGEIDVRRNDEFDETLRTQFPDGFLYFPFMLEVYPRPAAEAEARRAVARILEDLWAQQMPAVAACDYENDLPHGGGYKSRSVPWPLLS
jgi:hypothetical protein